MPEHRTRAQQRVDEIDISPTKLLADIETLKAELAEARARRRRSTSPRSSASAPSS